MASALKFCGRESELERLVTRWRFISDVKNPKPQVVLIKAERGIGKTRLALEFYRWLSENVDAPYIGSWTGYWPDTLTLVDRNLEVNPNPYGCSFHLPIPYLWWGLRAAHIGAENAVGGDAIATFDRYLAPHLVALLTRARMKDRVWEVFKAWAEVGLDLASSALKVDDIVAVGQGLFKTALIVSGALSANAVNDAMQIPDSRAETVLSDLAKIFNPEAITYASTPGVIFIDDAQFAVKDAALPSFIERLLYTAVNQQWPVMVLFTHWKTELSSELTVAQSSFTSILHHIREGRPTDIGPAASLPGGYLTTDENFEVIDLRPITDLSAALNEKLPGLKKEQSEKILEHTGGNPRFLEQVIAFLQENENYFENFDTSQPMTIEGLEATLKQTASSELFKIVYTRLHNAPQDIQEAICIASLQGMRFETDIVDAVARVHLGHDVRESLRKAEHAYGLLAFAKFPTDQAIGEFPERLFYQVAQKRLVSLGSLQPESTLQSTFRRIITSMVEDPDHARRASSTSLGMLYGIAANLFEHSEETHERLTAQRALGELAYLAFADLSLESACVAYERLLAIERVESQIDDRVRTLDFLARAYWKLNWPSKCSSAIKRRIYEAYSLIGDNGRIFALAGDSAGIARHFEEYKRKTISFWEEDPGPKTEEQMEALAVTLYDGAIRILVPALLLMGELARSWPTQNFAEGDDPIGRAPFMLILGEEGDDGTTNKDTAKEFADVYRDRAYNLGAFVEPELGERTHFHLLNDIARMYSSEEMFSSATAALGRALDIAKGLDQSSLQIQVMGNLAVVHGESGDREQSEKVLQEAGDLITKLHAGGTFSVAVLSDGSEIEFRRLEALSDADEARILQRLEMPVPFSVAFDKDPENAAGEFSNLVRMVGNIHGNRGHNAMVAGDLEKANKCFEMALESFVGVNDGPNIAQTLVNLGMVAKHKENLEQACDFWRRGIDVYNKVKEAHAGSNEILWNNAIRELETLMATSGCNQK